MTDPTHAPQPQLPDLDLPHPDLAEVGEMGVPSFGQLAAVCVLTIVVMSLACLAVWATTSRRRRTTSDSEQTDNPPRFAEPDIRPSDPGLPETGLPETGIGSRMRLEIDLASHEFAVVLTALSTRHMAGIVDANEYRRRAKRDAADAVVFGTLARWSGDDADRAARLYQAVEAADGAGEGLLVVDLSASELQTLLDALGDHVGACLVSAGTHYRGAAQFPGDALGSRALADSYQGEATCARALYVACGGAAGRGQHRSVEVEESP